MAKPIRHIELNTTPSYQIIEGGGLWNQRLFVFDELHSTNGWAIKHCALLHHGDVVHAIHQTKGRGRFSRSWSAPKSKALTLSVILTTSRFSEIQSRIGQIGALSILKALDSFRIKTQLKWPNDVMMKEKKISGILSEFQSKEKIIVLGIGVNVNTSHSDLSKAGLEKQATSMKLEMGRSFEIEEVRQHLQDQLERVLKKTEAEGSSFIGTEWTKHDWLSNCVVEIHRGDIKIYGNYQGLDKKGRIRISDQSGHEKVFWDGDVQKIKVLNP